MLQCSNLHLPSIFNVEKHLQVIQRSVFKKFMLTQEVLGMLTKKLSFGRASKKLRNGNRRFLRRNSGMEARSFDGHKVAGLKHATEIGRDEEMVI